MSKIRVMRRSGTMSITPAAVKHGLSMIDETDTTNDDIMEFQAHRFQSSAFEREDDGVWENKIDMVCNCDKAPTDVVVRLSLMVRRKIDLLMTKFKSQEWLAYLIGAGMDVTDMYIPKQHATTGNVSNIDSNIPDGMAIIGVIHSHHGMGAFFSGTDDDFINKNYNLSIVVSHTEMKGQVRFKIPCGALKITPVKVQTLFPKLFDEAEFDKEADEKISSTAYSYPTQKTWSPLTGWNCIP